MTLCDTLMHDILEVQANFFILIILLHLGTHGSKLGIKSIIEDDCIGVFTLYECKRVISCGDRSEFRSK